MVGRIFTEGDDFTSGRRIDHIRVGGRHSPFGNDVSVVLGRTGGSGIGGPGAQRFAFIGVKGMESRTRWVTKPRIEREAQKTALVVRVGRVQWSGANWRDLNSAFDI